MVSDLVKHLCVKEDTNIAEAFWIHMNAGYKAIVVVDNNQKYKGIVGHKDFLDNKFLDGKEKVLSIINKKAIYLYKDMNTYEKARDFFAQYNIENIPVLNNNGDFVDYFTRERAFYRQYYKSGSLERMNYAVNIMSAAFEAKRFGYNGISVIEFGVGGGIGLLAAQFHAREISKLIGIDIKVYGFDLGTGLPKSDEGKEVDNILHIFQPGFFVMNKEKLVNRLEENTILIIGDIKNTIKDFVDNYNPYPIGAIFIDVDTYQSTKYILDWMAINNYDNVFLPRIYMYFDDVFSQYEGIGEEKAIQEFNNTVKGMKISPEKISDDIGIYNTIGEHTFWLDNTDTWEKRRMKICHRFNDRNYNKLMLNSREISSLVCIENSKY